MNLLLHHLRKDLRHSRWMILATVLIAAGALWFPSVPLEDRANQISWLALPRYGGWVLLFMTVARLVLLDAPVHEGGFLRTRPVSVSTLFQAKCLTALVLIVPLAMIECIMLLMLGLQPGAMGLLLVFSENLLISAAIAAVGMALAIRQKTFGNWLASVLIWSGLLIVVGLVALWFQHFQQRSGKQEFSYAIKYLESSRLIITQLVILAGASLGIIWFTRRRRQSTILKALGITAACAAAAWFLWPVNFVKAIVPARRTAAKSEWPDQARLEFFTEDQHWRHNGEQYLTFTDGSWNDLRYRSIRGTYSLSGLPDGWQGGHNAYESKIWLANGTVLPSRQHAWAPINRQWILPELEIGAGHDKTKPPLFSVDYAEFNLADAAGAMEGASVKGLLHIPLKRAVLLARAPFKSGVSTFVANRRIDITKNEIFQERIDFNILAQTSLEELRGGWQKIWTDRIEYIVINAARGEFLQQQSSGQSNPVAGHYALQYETSSGGIFPDHERKEIPSDWLDGSELLIVSEEYGGTFSQPFEFSGVSLSNP